MSIEIPLRHEVDTTDSPVGTVRRMGGRALVEYYNLSPADELDNWSEPYIPSQPEGFHHLFPAHLSTQIDLIGKTATIEGAEELAMTLDGDDPYRDYSLSQLSLFHLTRHDNPARAYELLHAITDLAAGTYVLEQIIKYEDAVDQAPQEHEWVQPRSVLGEELKSMAVAAFNMQPDIHTAALLIEAQKAFPEDQDLEIFAGVAIEEYPNALELVTQS